MTTAITTIHQAETKRGVNRFARELGAAVCSLGDRAAIWSARYHDSDIGPELAVTPPGERIDTALRWHARRGRVL